MPETTTAVALKEAQTAIFDAITFTKAGTTEKTAVHKAIGELTCQTIVGPVDYSKQLKGLQYSSSVLTGGQWQRDENGTLVLVIIDNSLYPEIPITGEYLPGNATTKK